MSLVKSSNMFSARPEDIARFRETTRKNVGGFSTTVTFRCKRCKNDYKIEHRRRVSKYIQDGFVCVHCKEELVRKAKMNSTLLAED